MNNNYKFSVLLTVYKKDKLSYFKESLKSILEQTLVPNEILILCDGPLNNEFYDFFDEYCQNSIFKIVHFKNNRGLGLTLRDGVKMCKYDIIARMDSDDICKKDRFEKQINEFKKNPELDLLGGQIVEFYNDSINNILGNRLVPINSEDIKKFIKKRSPFNHMTVMYKKKAVIYSGNYENIFNNEDYKLWINMFLNNCVMKNLDDILVYVRVDNNFYSRRGGLKYFKSEYYIQKILLINKIIGYRLFLFNTFIRFVVQILLPSFLRGFLFKFLLRERND